MRSLAVYHEKRVQFRVQVEQPVVLSLLSLPGGLSPPRTTLAATTTDVSERGIRISFVDREAIGGHMGLARRSVHLVPPGSKVQLRIKPPGYWRCFIHVGTVRWVQQELESPVFVFGVELTDSPAHVMRRWLAYVERARTARRR